MCGGACVRQGKETDKTSVYISRFTNIKLQEQHYKSNKGRKEKLYMRHIIYRATCTMLLMFYANMKVLY